MFTKGVVPHMKAYEVYEVNPVRDFLGLSGTSHRVEACYQVFIKLTNRIRMEEIVEL